MAERRFFVLFRAIWVGTRLDMAAAMIRNVSLVAAVLLAAAGCGSESPSSASAEPAKSAAPTAGATTPAPAAEKKIELDAETQKLVRAAAEKCATNDATEAVEKCPAGEYDAIGTYAKDKKPANFHVTLAEMALTEGAKDKKIYAVAMNALGNFADAGGRDWLKAGATPEAAERTLKLIADAPEGYGWYFGRAVTIPLSAGRIDETTAALKATKAKDVRRNGFVYYLKYAGIGALPAVQALVKDSSLKPEERGAAMRSVSSGVDKGIFGNEVTLGDADKTKACDWAKEMAGDADFDVAKNAWDALGDCGGAYIDAALTAIEPLAATGTHHEMITGAFHQCWGHAVVGRPPNGNAEQCKKAFDIVVKVSERSDIKPHSLSWAVTVLGAIARDTADIRAKGKDLVTKYKTHKEKSVADSAERALKEFK